VKVCDNCWRVNQDGAETCIGCGGTEFTPLLTPFYDSKEEYDKETEEDTDGTDSA